MNKHTYKNHFEKKMERIDIRLDSTMVERLKIIRAKTGISVSELLREALRHTLQQYLSDE
jgi:predicted DNA binding CopG/RHH family protein